MNILRYLKTVRRDITWVAVGALLFVFAMDLCFRNIPELFDSASKLGEIVYRLCLSLVSSYVFYFIVVHIKSEKDKENINTYLAKEVPRIIGCCRLQLNTFAQYTVQSSCDLWQNTDEIKTIFQSLSPNGQSPLMLGFPMQQASWLQYLDFQRATTSNIVSRIFRKASFLDTKLVDIFSRLDDCSHFNQLITMGNTPVQNQNLLPWASTFIDYVELCKELQNYYDEKLKFYEIT